jgi:hypothetical protein
MRCHSGDCSVLGMQVGVVVSIQVSDEHKTKQDETWPDFVSP